MLTRTTAIGIGVGAAIIAIGLYALVTSIGLQKINFDEKVPVGDSITYQFVAPKSAHQYFNVTGDSFHIKLQTPGGGIQADDEFKKQISFDWYVLEEGTNRIQIQNTGQSELSVRGTFEKNTDPILFTYHIMVLTAGVVIIGFSAGFSARKPKGF
ncbi:MAG: hypothetical protein QW177_08925 [Candidatus Nitrosotenuis sp.]